MSENNASPTSSGNSSSESSSVTPSNEHKTQLSESKTRRKSFVRCKSIDLDDSFNLYRSITNTPRSDSQSYSNEITEKSGEKDPISNEVYNTNHIERYQSNDIFKIEGERSEYSNNNAIIDMLKRKKYDNIKNRSTNLELKLLPPPLQKFDLNRTKVNLECDGKATSLPLTPSESNLPTTPSTAPPLYSSVFANVGKCVMMPIDKEYETKYLLMNKMNGINGVNSFIPPGMRVKPEKTIQEHVYLFLEHPCGWLCFFYHMFV